MVPLEAPYPDVNTDTFIFFLRSLCKIIWMNVHYFPNAPRTFVVLIKIKQLTVKENTKGSSGMNAFSPTFVLRPG